MTETAAHGRSAYVNQGCRCDSCKAANSAYKRAHRERTQHRYDRAYARALSRLIETHRDELLDLVQEELTQPDGGAA